MWLCKGEIADLSVHIVLYSYPGSKKRDKEVQYPVHITLNWINVLFDTLAKPFIPG